MGWLDWLAGSSPGVAMGQAGSEVIKGMAATVNSLIEEWHLPPGQELEAKLKVKQLELDTLQAHLQDTQSARQMQTATRSPIPAILTVIVTVGFFGVLATIIIWGMPKIESTGTEALLLLLGTLTTAFASVLGFWFGKNSGTDETRNMLYNSAPVKRDPTPPIQP